MLTSVTDGGLVSSGTDGDPVLLSSGGVATGKGVPSGSNGLESGAGVPSGGNGLEIGVGVSSGSNELEFCAGVSVESKSWGSRKARSEVAAARNSISSGSVLHFPQLYYPDPIRPHFVRTSATLSGFDEREPREQAASKD